MKIVMRKIKERGDYGVFLVSRFAFVFERFGPRFLTLSNQSGASFLLRRCAVSIYTTTITLFFLPLYTKLYVYTRVL